MSQNTGCITIPEVNSLQRTSSHSPRFIDFRRMNVESHEPDPQLQTTKLLSSNFKTTTSHPARLGGGLQLSVRGKSLSTRAGAVGLVFPTEGEWTLTINFFWSADFSEPTGCILSVVASGNPQVRKSTLKQQ